MCAVLRTQIWFDLNIKCILIESIKQYSHWLNTHGDFAIEKGQQGNGVN